MQKAFNKLALNKYAYFFFKMVSGIPVLENKIVYVISLIFTKFFFFFFTFLLFTFKCFIHLEFIFVGDTI